jgi:site-specific DNA-methyltransferase (adenine-specific)
MDKTRVENIDCMIRLRGLLDNHFDLAVVDPPFGINIAKWDTLQDKPSMEYFETLFRISKNQIIWGGNYFNLPPSEAWICWDKTFRSGKSAFEKTKSEFELAWTSFDVKAKMIHYTYDGNIHGFNGGRADYEYKPIHPTQKPVALYKWLLKNYAKEGDKILDTHLGSQSSRIAAFDMGFDFTGYELDKDYFEAGNKRFNQHKAQLKLFS